MVAVGTLPEIRMHPRIRLAVALGFGLAIILAIATLIKYPGSGQFQSQHLLLGLMLIAVVLVVGAAITFLAMRTRSASGARVLRTSVILGVVLGLLWVVEINYNNLLTPPVEVRDPVDDIFWAAIALGIFALAVWSSRGTRSFSQGIFSGFWSGTVSGLIACLMGEILVVFFISLVTRDPVSVQEWNDFGASSGAPDITTYFAYETLAGALLHLFVLGMIMGVLLGALGGAVGKGASLIANRGAAPSSHAD